ncbi:MAG: ABC transporter ATP-binding protein [Planctomycetes bacterium]|nr:ABC transporter ATP-binding protein [Planctomycetota bacterium]
MEPIVTAEGLFKFHARDGQKLAILRDVSFEVGPAEFVCIMGPSGSGKSTLLHMLSGLDEPSAGLVKVRGKDMAQLSEEARTLERRASIGYVFQFFNLLPNLTVMENVGLPLAIAGGRPEAHHGEILALLDKLGIASKAGSFPHQLSGGEMQRTSIARALAGGQPLLLCDEPTGNLSQKAGLEVMQILRKLVDDDKRAVLLVTHNPRDAAFADRVAFLVDGLLAAEPVLRGPDIPVENVHAALAALHI